MARSLPGALLPLIVLSLGLSDPSVADEPLVLKVLTVDDRGQVLSSDRLVSAPEEAVLRTVRENDPTRTTLYRYPLHPTGPRTCETSL